MVQTFDPCRKLLILKLSSQALSPPFSFDASPYGVTARSTSSQTPLSAADFSAYREYLPATFCKSRNALLLLLQQGNVSEVLRQELCVPSLSKPHEYLWWCARPAPAMPLHEQIMEKRTITVTEQASLHLVCPSRRIFIKPLPPYLLRHDFWAQHLCNDADLHKCGVGFLLSYAWLIRHESDLAIAEELHLVPKTISWKAWTLFVDSLLTYINCQAEPDSCVNKRYLYGEVRLPRLNIVAWYAPEMRGFKCYVKGYGQSSMFFKRNFEWMGLGFLYLVAILTAMQVGLAADHLKNNASFNRASYIFSVFCILLPVTIVAALALRHTFCLIGFSCGRMRRREAGTSAV